MVTEIVHKKRPTAWHRDGDISPCGVKLIERLPMWNKKVLASYSYLWKDVTCPVCLEFLRVVEVTQINKFIEPVKKR